MTKGDAREQTGRQRWCHRDTIDVLFVPEGRTADDVIAEIRSFGRLTDVTRSTPGQWSAIRCPGGPEDCFCQDGHLGPGYRYENGDQLVCWYDPDRDLLVFA